MLVGLYCLTTADVTREPRARDSGARGPREYWWEAPNRESAGEGHRAEPREYRSGVPGLGSISGKSENLGKHQNQEVLGMLQKGV